MKIQETQLGLPEQTATDLLITILSFRSDATICGLFFDVTSDDGTSLATGNVYLTETEFANWGANNTYIEDIVLSKLGLSRLV